MDETIEDSGSCQLSVAVVEQRWAIKVAPTMSINSQLVMSTSCH